MALVGGTGFSVVGSLMSVVGRAAPSCLSLLAYRLIPIASSAEAARVPPIHHQMRDVPGAGNAFNSDLGIAGKSKLYIDKLDWTSSGDSCTSATNFFCCRS